MLRKCSSVAIRAFHNFGYGKVGGSSPSTSTYAVDNGQSLYTLLGCILALYCRSYWLRKLSPMGSWPRLAGSIPAHGTYLRESSSVFRAPYDFDYMEVGGSNPSSPTKLCSGSSNRICRIVESASVDNLPKCRAIPVPKSSSGGATEARRKRASILVEVGKGWWFESTPGCHYKRRKIMLRKCSSVAFRAFYNFGYKKVGGSSPSTSTICGGSIGNAVRWNHLIMRDNALNNGKLIKTMRLVASSQWEIFKRGAFEPFSSHQVYGRVAPVFRAFLHVLVPALGKVGGSNPSPSAKFNGMCDTAVSMDRMYHFRQGEIL